MLDRVWITDLQDDMGRDIGVVNINMRILKSLWDDHVCNVPISLHQDDFPKSKDDPTREIFLQLGTLEFDDLIKLKLAIDKFLGL